ncbi:glycosyltransferase [Kitasatospora acidiphila]|uniref:Glycosyltransferase n=1 Tax=Kitasatospora acidiphila TaxID=2567942 RepID=A0A540W065_9ACTN|nr:glycosyltransferase [Kitasatospora acidiphila]TQF01744.1 glycosyltransferase [Kitasatospora acidiphila]
MSDQVHPVSLVSVVMPARNAEATIATQLAALGCQTYPGAWEVIAVENGSSDGTRALLRSWQQRMPQLRVVDAADGCGVNRARNIGCHHARGEFVLCCDADDVVAPGWMAGLVDVLGTTPAVGGALERRKLNARVALAARPPKESDALLDTFAFLPYPAGANCGFHKELWRRLGGFDESYRYGSDDVEFFWRAQLAGHRLAFAPGAVVHYRLRAEPRAIERQLYRYGRSHPQLYRDFADHGMPPSRLPEAAAAWGSLLIRLPDLVGPADRRAALLAQLAMRTGRIVGSARYRRCYL